jgi:transcription-repair coupling factor (superfamily II helicase)
MARELIEVHAARQVIGKPYGPADEMFQEFSALPRGDADQERAIEDVLGDLPSHRPMDRLRAATWLRQDGDRARAAFKVAAPAGRSPSSFPRRSSRSSTTRPSASAWDYPITVEELSRFKAPKVQKQTLARLEAGKVDVIIGTHRLLGADVRFRDLGLLVVDEEQRFGVRHKERIKRMRRLVDVLTLTATPIPRTLHMAMLGLRISVRAPRIAQPSTFVMVWDDGMRKGDPAELARAASSSTTACRPSTPRRTGSGGSCRRRGSSPPTARWRSAGWSA